MTPEERAAVNFANDCGPLLSLLYDLDLMPEQVMGDADEWARMLSVVSRFQRAIAEEREACAQIAETNPNEKVVYSEDSEVFLERRDIADAIRARTTEPASTPPPS